MKKYFITDRRTGLGDCLLNLAACWYLGKKHSRDVIIDWRRLPYTIKDYESYTRHHINLYNSVFKIPDSIDGVNFHLIEEFPDLFIGPKSQDGHPYDLDHLPHLDQTNTHPDYVNKILKSGDFIRNSMRFGQTNKSYSDLSPGIEYCKNFDYLTFFSNLKLSKNINSLISSLKSKFIKKNTVAIHFRHGNGESIRGRGENWIGPENGALKIKEEIVKFLGNDLSAFNFLIFSDSIEAERELLKKLSNSHVALKKDNAPQDGGAHFNVKLNPIKSFQESAIDMILMSFCNYIFYTDKSMFSVLARLKIPKSNQKMIFDINKKEY
jgi:hypothetical protein